MIEFAERRRVIRLSVPRHLSDPTPELRLVRLLDLSVVGARIEHATPLDRGVMCTVDFAPTLGRAQLPGWVMWTRPYKREPPVAGEAEVYYQSGLAFVNLTPPQQKALAAALDILAYRP